MSKIQEVSSGYLRVSNREKLKRNGTVQHFGAGLGDVRVVSKDLGIANKELEIAKKIVLDAVEEKVAQKVGKTGKFFQWLADTSGEVQTQSINGVFTTTLAPLMIVFNPFLKNKSKEDKQYLALRQPISAIIALSGGLAMTAAVNKFQDKIYNDGFVQSIDLRLAPSKSYLQSSFNSAFNDAKKNNKLNEFIALYDKDVSELKKANGFKGNKISSSFKKACFELGYVKKVQDQRLDLFTALISENPENIKIDGSGNIVINGKNLQEGHLVKAPNLNTSKDLNAYIQKSSLHNFTLGDLMKDKFKFEFHKDAELGESYKIHINDRKLSETKALDFLEEIGLIKAESVSENELKETLLKYRQNLHKNEFGTAVNLAADNAEKALNIVGADASRNIQMTVGEPIGKAKSISLGQLFHQIGYKTSTGKTQKLMDTKMADALIELKNIFNGKLKGVDDKVDLKDFAKNMLKKSIKGLGENAKNHRYYVGIVINLFTTLVTCTILNWSYPRIVEALFPNIAKSKSKPPQFSESSKTIEAKKGGNK